MDLITIDNNVAIPNAYTLTIQEFKVIVDRDKTATKKKATQELAYVYFKCDHRSPFAVYGEEERGSEVKLNVFGLDSKWQEDEKIKAACDKYKELSEGELTLLQHEVDKIELLTETILNNEVVHSLIREGNVEYEVPAVGQILSDMYWKGKADIINHDDRLIIDLKTTGNIQQFASSARKYNYDSQAYIYQKLFGYEMVFIAIDKNTHQIGIFDCSNEFLERGATKVLEAEEQYRLFFENEDFDPKNYFLTKTL